MRLSWACVRAHVRAQAPARNSKSSQKRAALHSSGNSALLRDSASPKCMLFTSLKHVLPPAAMHCSTMLFSFKVWYPNSKVEAHR